VRLALGEAREESGCKGLKFFFKSVYQNLIAKTPLPGTLVHTLTNFNHILKTFAESRPAYKVVK